MSATRIILSPSAYLPRHDKPARPHAWIRLTAFLRSRRRRAVHPVTVWGRLRASGAWSAVAEPASRPVTRPTLPQVRAAEMTLEWVMEQLRPVPCKLVLDFRMWLLLEGITA